MKRCETCFYWDKNEHQIGTVHKCTMPVMFWDATDWSVDSGRALKPEFSNQKAFVSDGSDYYAEFSTTKDFGCIEHKEK